MSGRWALCDAWIILCEITGPLHSLLAQGVQITWRRCHSLRIVALTSSVCSVSVKLFILPAQRHSINKSVSLEHSTWHYFQSQSFSTGWWVGAAVHLAKCQQIPLLLPRVAISGRLIRVIQSVSASYQRHHGDGLLWKAASPVKDARKHDFNWSICWL